MFANVKQGKRIFIRFPCLFCSLFFLVYSKYISTEEHAQQFYKNLIKYNEHLILLFFWKSNLQRQSYVISVQVYQNYKEYANEATQVTFPLNSTVMITQQFYINLMRSCSNTLYYFSFKGAIDRYWNDKNVYWNWLLYFI